MSFGLSLHCKLAHDQDFLHFLIPGIDVTSFLASFYRALGGAGAGMPV